MRKVFGTVLGVVIGVVVPLIVGTVVSAISMSPPELMVMQTAEAVTERVASTPNITWITTMVAIALGAFLGGIIGVKVARGKRVLVTSVIGAALSFWGLYSLYVVFPAVLWFPIGNLVSVLLFSYLGGVVAVRSQRKQTVR